MWMESRERRISQCAVSVQYWFSDGRLRHWKADLGREVESVKRERRERSGNEGDAREIRRERKQTGGVNIDSSDD